MGILAGLEVPEEGGGVVGFGVGCWEVDVAGMGFGFRVADVSLWRGEVRGVMGMEGVGESTSL